ncbi:MAG: hypothetical protein ACREVG_09865 [Burkholderiales bacterium]
MIGVIALAASLHGYLYAELRLWQRGVLFVAALLMMAPELISSLIGLPLFGVVIALQLPRRHARARAGSPGS